ncbi:MAG: hypothetical protein A2Y03_03635 [Omnitrophica WOR_2 bacterium GWF2_38_59]|nr:MAG: hypothetical protein A2Y06_01540 [Omnitrophica WOR_2 bacterium GWA2_37_7]OGX25856.1 MAG: hypothetical protein A2Y03_03635 [Omnitrophica WOR_2 bacterium GWF2_38_59]OGX47630.1 MAG: hypothetical protein A2243_07980 [Omnitrophica WOR_2 bacterium RIFOXYA2_FULL_38_17]OGX55958.1 MAG: hypothetical protein A2447_03180 [Omnitrophica WOR_2 bacterium RIFOXYC2_FULL_38_12]OGX56866.1 MAG: hypothetical protein A2306_05550 [Omnitrophica WOR_2 bacterium RIFOXYB2_FULL_38_16]HBG61337.1 hypothetical protei
MFFIHIDIQIGGSAESKLDRVINVVFVIAIALLFFADTLMHLFKVPVMLPPMFSIEGGLLLVSVKIICFNEFLYY